jgi:DNA modification methylase
MGAPMIEIIQGDVRQVIKTLPDNRFDCIVTSPPYWGLRDYGCEGQIGLEPTLQEYIDTMVAVCGELKRALKPEGTFWLNIGDAYAGSWGAQSRDGKENAQSRSRETQIRAHPKMGIGTGSLSKTPGLKAKDLMMIPARLAIALQEQGWWIRKEIVWHKLNPMPESVTDRPTSAHEMIYLLTKSESYFYDADAVREKAYDTGRKNGRDGRAEDEYARPPGSSPRKLARLDYSDRGRNMRDVWSIASQPFAGAHFATFPQALAERCIKAGSPIGGLVLDPFGGAGTTGLVADRLGRNATLIELNPEYVELARRRINSDGPLFCEVATV